MRRKRPMAPGGIAGGRGFSGLGVGICCALLIGLWSATAEAKATVTLSETELKDVGTELRAVLASTNEKAYAQILTLVEIVRDPVLNTTSVYDIIVHYDPDRYSNPRVGSYPLSFENQFMHWGRRVALYTQRTSWSSGRFYLRDISAAHEAWILTSDARLLIRPMRKNIPYTDLRTMSAWLRLMHPEDRELANRRRLREIEAKKNSLLKDLKP
ncbi:MAG TPA: hypothetical protein EYG11_11010 [Candidatus Latescibacteria bacterium]|nr:hypothetical protein [Candidatus Handelsmanbacteria bacterium]HIL09223.1 hypothetical protein [Candidatus Latescibacterota bacterium]